MAKTLIDRFTSTDEGMRLFQQEKLILDFTEIICGLIRDDEEMSRIKLAHKIDLTGLDLDRMLNGEVEITLRVAADLAWAMGCTLTLDDVPLTLHMKATKVKKEKTNE